MEEPDRLVIIPRNVENGLDTHQGLQNVGGVELKQVSERGDGQLGFKKQYGANDPLENITARSSGENLSIKRIRACMYSQCYGQLSVGQICSVVDEIDQGEGKNE